MHVVAVEKDCLKHEVILKFGQLYNPFVRLIKLFEHVITDVSGLISHRMDYKTEMRYLRLIQ